ncbi:hypothetical protein [Rhodanobacter sp. C03]|uniref:hypothetical protein n=1 Tax=Rhodanobacter sp. C03 TaxID=1945858 RepID=UPI000987424A|nr:hypothetical protein [Rhodanobacter sp. C03]OOG53741.1 hypothetical protein B0E48_15830 [Rhodanobacter sp. C03]
MSPQDKRKKLTVALVNLPPHMRDKLAELKAEGETDRARPDLLWFLLLRSSATHGKSSGWNRFRDDDAFRELVSYHALAPLNRPERIGRILASLQTAKVRMPTVKAPRLAFNFELISGLGGVEAASIHMLNLPDRHSKFDFMTSFAGIGEKYGRNIWMDIYDPHFRDTIAVDVRLRNLAVGLGHTETSYDSREHFFRDIARDCDLEAWELDRLLYHYEKHFLRIVETG